jgi:hypothetical protein
MRYAPAVAAIALASQAPMAAQTVPAEAYARAEALLPQHVRKLIPGLSVRPRWIGETSRFWFEKQTRAGREYLLVDAPTGTSQPLFDHDALIAALAAATAKPIERKDFQLPGLRVDAKTGTLRFSRDGKSWRYDPGTRALAEDPPVVGESPDGAWRAVVRMGNRS